LRVTSRGLGDVYKRQRQKKENITDFIETEYFNLYNTACKSIDHLMKDKIICSLMEDNEIKLANHDETKLLNIYLNMIYKAGKYELLTEIGNMVLLIYNISLYKSPDYSLHESWILASSDN
jgi:hypothetical protein